MVEETYRAAFMLHCSRVRSLAAAVNHVALKGDAVEAMRLVEELRVARSAKTLAQQELRAVKGAQPAGTAAPLMITAAAATDEDVWPVSSRPPPAVPEGIRRVALEEISAADVAECGCHFAPWYTPYFSRNSAWRPGCSTRRRSKLSGSPSCAAIMMPCRRVWRGSKL